MTRKEYLRNARIAAEKKRKENTITIKPNDPFYAFAAYSFGLMTEDEVKTYPNKKPNRSMPVIRLSE